MKISPKYIVLVLLFTLGCASKKKITFTEQVSEDLVESFDLKDKEFQQFKVEESDATPKKVKPKVVSKATKEIKRSPKKKVKQQEIASKKPSNYQEYIKDYLDRPYPVGYPNKLKKYTHSAYETWKLFDPVFYPGEEFTVSVSYLGITAGYVKIKTRNKVKIAGESAYVISASMKSADYYEYIYKLDDNIESIIQKKFFLPAKYTLIQRETNQNVDDLQLFDNKKLKTFYWYKRLKKGKKKKEHKVEYIPKFYQDSFSSLYFVRGLPLKKGDRYQFPIITRGKMWVITLDVIEYDEVKVMGEWTPSIKIKAETHFPGVLKKKGDIIFWYSRDKFKKLLKFQAKVKIGTVEGELVGYKPASGVGID